MNGAPVNASAVFLVLVFAAVFAAAQAIWGVLRVSQTRRKVNHRLKVVERLASLGDLVLELRKQRGLNEKGERGSKWLASLITRSGVPFDRRKWSLAVGVSALACGVAGFVLLRNPLGLLPGGLFGAIFVPLMFLKMKASKREKALAAQLPEALEVVVRSLEAGHPIPTAIALVGREMPDPIGSEFGMAADEISFGATLEQAVGRIADRCQQPDIDLFAATVRLQERSGGNLVGLLKMNAKTVRERLKMRLKIKAASSEARASALILTAAPFVVVGMLQLMAPGYYGEVIHRTMIHIGLGVVAVWMTIGVVMMQRMVNMKV
ncbi:MAG TPA: type II secretion system F family protein [Caulobacteraceae bacterium]|jgi:tight adherence protein B